MAQLKDTLIQGSLRVTDSLFTDILNISSTTTATLTSSTTRSGALNVAGGIAVGEAIKVGKLTIGATHSTTGDTYITSDDTMTFKVTDASSNVYTSLILDQSYVLPYGNGNRYLGKTDQRWKNIYSQELNTTSRIHPTITGSGVAGVTYSSNPVTNGVPALWKLNLSIDTPADGDVVTFKVPSAGHASGVYLSLNNGTTTASYKPIAVSGSTKLTTHYPTNSIISLAYDSGGQVTAMYPVAGAGATATVTGGCWRVINYYDSGNTNTLIRTYASATNLDLPLILMNFSASATATYTHFTSNYKNVYGAIANDAEKVATLNPSTGLMKVPSLQLTNALAVASGGTGAGTFTADCVIVGNGTNALAQRGIYITGALGANAALSTTDTKTLTITSGSTLYIDSKSTASHIFRKGTTTCVVINPSGNLEISSTATQSSHKLLVNGDSAFTGKIEFTNNANSLTKYASIQYDSTLEAIKFVF